MRSSCIHWPLRNRVCAALLLGVFVTLNAAAVLPVLHALWHDDHACEQADCAVFAVAQGTLDPGPAGPQVVPCEGGRIVSAVAPESPHAVDRPLLPPGRAPPLRFA